MSSLSMRDKLHRPACLRNPEERTKRLTSAYTGSHPERATCSQSLANRYDITTYYLFRK